MGVKVNFDELQVPNSLYAMKYLDLRNFLLKEAQKGSKTAYSILQGAEWELDYGKERVDYIKSLYPLGVEGLQEVLEQEGINLEVYHFIAGSGEVVIGIRVPQSVVDVTQIRRMARKQLLIHLGIDGELEEFYIEV